ncbi:hypothetical protein HBH56_000460 [Parastagonospora nodorum]|uniref:Uncharacterized protein n=2 Tax=Phaeosphaeria nodorum (strain SN15 / ATCC MYA-4574 / FGSC 10173) TaxID=321614 RepID=A0A7U2ENE3_PHANO|nr:hypothetical protein SNOG_09477 [Parastagonospora nodorum SN15]KAH3920149.1 hypothetical protein HBH56_000460 [Parastagonospora nodorum]EAT82742.1 hypothetical protein SNOG_09477 [Parastagonospora nodorum SN15]KAH3937622.1 hypothetical protein HBH54_000470 [Parastagonospora nodorum]KAH3958556.1 hypothetical protein HBH51_208300 [Parastagonospora nodorum]KAH4145650.1 hypothetical protein HBH45_012060 [Parastagonospora nodorum]
MGYRTERDKDGNKIPRERSGKPRRQRDDHLNLSKQTGTPVYPPSSSVYKHAQPFYLPDTQNTSKPGLVPTVAQSDPLLAPSDRQHHSLPIVLETPWPPRPSASQEDRVRKDLLAKIPPTVQNPMSVGHTGSSAASTGSSCPPVTLAGYRDPVPDPHRIKDTKASIQDPFIDPQDTMNTRGPSIPVSRKLVTDSHRATTRDPSADLHCVKDAHESSIRDPSTDSRRVTDTRKSSGAAPRDPTTNAHSAYAATRNVADARGSWGAAVQDPFSDSHSVPATRHSPSTATRAAKPSKPDAPREIPGAYPEPEPRHSAPHSAVSSMATLHAPVSTRRQTQRPVVPSIHPFRRTNNSPARSTDTSGNSTKYVSPRHPLPMPAHPLALPSPLSGSSASSSACSSISKHANASHAQKLATSSQTTSSSRPSPSSMSPAPSPSPPPSYHTLSPLPPPPPPPLPAGSSALFELEQNPWALSPRSPMPRKSSLKRGDSPRSARNVGFSDTDEVRTYEEDEAANKVGMGR